MTMRSFVAVLLEGYREPINSSPLAKTYPSQRAELVLANKRHVRQVGEKKRRHEPQSMIMVSQPRLFNRVFGLRGLKLQLPCYVV
eukprot:scaffold3256_cov120-Skeletonema_menzelii.AAC.1